MWWSKSLILALERGRQISEFEAILVYIVRTYLRQNKVYPKDGEGHYRTLSSGYVCHGCYNQDMIWTHTTTPNRNTMKKVGTGLVGKVKRCVCV